MGKLKVSGKCQGCCGPISPHQETCRKICWHGMPLDTTYYFHSAQTLSQYFTLTIALLKTTFLDELLERYFNKNKRKFLIVKWRNML